MLVQNKQKINAELTNKGKEINFLLDLFGGKLSLSDILDNDIPLIRLLRDTRISMNEELEKDNMMNRLASARITKL